MAYRHRYVDPNATGSATGTSWANAYTSLNTAENTEDDSGDIRATGGSNEIVVFHCRSSSGTADSAAQVNFDGWLTDSGGYIVVVCDAAGTSYGGGETDSIGGRHGGVWSASKYRLMPSDANPLRLGEDYVRVDGLQLASVSPTVNARDVIIVASITATTNDIRISNCLLVGHAHATYTQYGLNISDADTNLKAWNCIVYGIAAISGNRAAFLNAATVSLYSCTFIGGQYGVVTYGTTTMKNCYVGNSSVQDFYRGGGTLVKVNCASDDASADYDNGSTETQSNCVINATYSTSSGAYFTNVTAGSEDLRIASASSALVNAGTDTSGESAPLNFTTDIAGQTRA